MYYLIDNSRASLPPSLSLEWNCEGIENDLIPICINTTNNSHSIGGQWVTPYNLYFSLWTTVKVLAHRVEVGNKVIQLCSSRHGSFALPMHLERTGRGNDRGPEFVVASPSSDSSR